MQNYFKNVHGRGANMANEKALACIKKRNNNTPIGETMVIQLEENRQASTLLKLANLPFFFWNG